MEDKFNISFQEKWFDKDDEIIPNPIPMTEPIKILRWLGFKHGFTILVLDTPVQYGSIWRYQVKMQYKWLMWLNFKLWKIKI